MADALHLPAIVVPPFDLWRRERMKDLAPAILKDLVPVWRRLRRPTPSG